MKRARARTKRKPGEMNRLETDWAAILEARRIAGEIVKWWYEPVSMRLAAKGAWYKPDFMVIDSDGFVEFHETKGFMREAANVRLKVVADLYPHFLFRLIYRIPKKAGGGFNVTVVGPKESEKP